MIEPVHGLTAPDGFATPALQQHPQRKRGMLCLLEVYLCLVLVQGGVKLDELDHGLDASERHCLVERFSMLTQEAQAPCGHPRDLRQYITNHLVQLTPLVCPEDALVFFIRIPSRVERSGGLVPAHSQDKLDTIMH